MTFRLLLISLFGLYFSFIGQTQNHVQLEKIGSYETNIFNLGAAEISAFHSGSQRLFFVNAANQSIDVLDVANPNLPTFLFSIDVSPFGANANSLVIVKNAVAAAVEADPKQDPGKIVLWDIDGTFIQELQVGALPDMIAVSSDEHFLITANEGEPSLDYSIDPVGSVSVVEVPENLEDLSQNNVITLGFEAFEYRRASFGDEVDWLWEWTANPPAFNLGQATWGEVAELAGMSPTHGDAFWAGENVSEALPADLEFASITSEIITTNDFAQSISFRYFTQGFDLNDTLAYQIRLNGEAFDDVDDIQTLDHENAWTKVSIPVPPNTQVQIRILLKQAGLGTAFGLDDLRINHFEETIKVNGNFGRSSVKQDFEPEYIAIAEDNSRAWISLQENNGFIELDLQNLSFTGIHSYGVKDHNDDDFGMDANDQDGEVNILPWPVFGLLQPDAIYTYAVNGVNYIVTANEGDVREYGDFVEDARLSSITLDPTAFPNASLLQSNDALGRLKVNAQWGDTDLDGDLDQIYSFGARSFSIFTSDGELVYDSMSEFEEFTGDLLGDNFNTNNDNNNSFDSRSDDKGPEPEGVVLGKINDRVYAFIGLERVGGIMVYDVTVPNETAFVQYINPRDFSAPANSSLAGDLGPEGLLFIPKSESVYGRDLLVVSNEISGTVSFYEIQVDEIANGSAQLEIYPWITPPSIGQYNEEEVLLGGLSGLAVNWNNPNECYAVSDRGPVFNASAHPLATSTESEFTPLPNYHPQLLRFSLENDELQLLQQDTVYREGSPLLGLPSSNVNFGDELVDALGEDPLFVSESVDPEAISLRGDGALLVANENESSIFVLENNQVQEEFLPFEFNEQANVLDSALLQIYRQEGIKALTQLPNGNIVFTTSAGLNTQNEEERSALHRIYEVAPTGETIRLFVYESTFRGVGLAEITDMVAVNNDELLILESFHQGDFHFEDVFRVILTSNAAINEDNLGGMAIESFSNAEDFEQTGEEVLAKEHFLDLIEYNWDKSWVAEGLTLLNDSTLLLVNDNRFGLSSPLNDGVLAFSGIPTQFFKLQLQHSFDLVSPICPVSILGPSTACEGDSIVLNVSEGFESWEWSTGEANGSLTVHSPQTVQITARTAEGCVATSSADLIFNPLPNYDPLEDVTICYQTSVNIGFPQNDTLDFSWVGLEEEQITLNHEELPLGQISFPFEVSTVNNCVQQDTLFVSVRPELAPPLSSFYDFCEGDSLMLSVQEYSEVFWSNGSEGEEGVFTEEGVFSVEFTDEFDCSSSQDFFVNQNPEPTLNLGGDWEICEGETLILNAGAFDEVLWSTGSTDPFISVYESGEYSAEVLDANGCYTTDTVEVNVVFCASVSERKLELDLFPNPADDVINLHHLELGGNYELRNLQTAIVQKGVLQVGANTIDVSNLVPGTYFIIVKNNNKVWSERFVKE